MAGTALSASPVDGGRAPDRRLDCDQPDIDGAIVSRIELPTPILFAWIVLTLVLMGQGMRLAADRQAEREPARPPVLLEGASLEVAPSEGAIVFRDSSDARLAVFQELPERRLLRWVESEAPGGEILLIPLDGLGPGDYVVADAPARTGAAEQEMDRPDATLSPRARFTVLPD